MRSLKNSSFTEERPSRRRILGAVGTIATAAVAGCTGGSGGDESEQTDDESTDDGADESEGGLPSYDDEAAASFVLPEDGQEAANGVQVEMVAENFDIEPSSEGVSENAGHWHVLVDTDPVEEGEVIPSDDQHLHFGDGSEQAVLDLEPGDHTLVLQPADGQHRAYPFTDEVDVTVQEASVSFATLEDGDTVESPVEATFEASDNVTVEEAGEITQSAGHWHVMVNTEAVETGTVIPSDDEHLHFGDGSSTVELDLPEGEHDLVLQLANGAHQAMPETDEITITVE